MSRKPKFKPEITRVKLNPEQAVLACTCYNNQRWTTSGGTQQSAGSNWACVSSGKGHTDPNWCGGGGANTGITTEPSTASS